MDGGLRNNNPAGAPQALLLFRRLSYVRFNGRIDLALDEAYKLFGQRACDVVLSLGTGFFQDESRYFAERVMRTIDTLAESATCTHRGWDAVGSRLRDSGAGMFRFNPEFDQDIALDDVSALPIAEEATVKFLALPQTTSHLVRCALRILASNFYFELHASVPCPKNSNRANTQGNIVSRIADLPQLLINGLEKHIYVQVGDQMPSLAASPTPLPSLLDPASDRKWRLAIAFSHSVVAPISILLSATVFAHDPTPVGETGQPLLAPIGGFPVRSLTRIDAQKP